VRTVRSPHGFTLIELLIVIAVIAIVAAIAIPGLLRARMSSNEAAAIGSLRAVNTAQQNYAQFCRGFGTTLPHLGFAPAASNQPFLSQDLTSGAAVMKSGYLTTMVPGAGNGAIPNVTPGCPPGTGSAYYASAVAVTLGTTGTRTFATNGSGTIWQNIGAAPPAEPFAVAGTVSPIQ